MDNFSELAVDAIIRVTYKEEMRQVLAELAEIMVKMERLTDMLVGMWRERREKAPLAEAEAAACDRREQRVERALASTEQKLRNAAKWFETEWHSRHRW